VPDGQLSVPETPVAPLLIENVESRENKWRNVVNSLQAELDQPDEERVARDEEAEKTWGNVMSLIIDSMRPTERRAWEEDKHLQALYMEREEATPDWNSNDLLYIDC
jgi:hypothetical protein